MVSGTLLRCGRRRRGANLRDYQGTSLLCIRPIWLIDFFQFLRFSFWGAGCNNYGNELLELACNFLAEFPEDLKKIIFENYLVNPSGRRGHWFELDLLQEHFNFWLKRLFNTKTTSFEAHHLSVNVSRCTPPNRVLRSHNRLSLTI